MTTEAYAFDDLKNPEATIAAIDFAQRKGVSPELILRLTEDDPPAPDSKEGRFIGWATIATVAMIGGGVMASRLNPDVQVSETVREVANLIFTPGNAPVENAQLKTVIEKGLQWGISFGESSILIGFILNRIKEGFIRTAEHQTLIERQHSLKELVRNGEVRIPMRDGYTAIDLGVSGDAIGRSIGSTLGWGTNVLAFMEGEHNLSGYPLWARMPQLSSGIEIQEYFESLDRVRFHRAGCMVLCPVKVNQAFLPDIANPDHFDMSMSETIDKIWLLDTYCERRRVPKKPFVVIADGGLSVSIAPYVENGSEAVCRSFTLKETIDEMNKNRPPISQIVLLDPTEVTLDELAEIQNLHNGLPFEFFQDPTASEQYGERFMDRCRKRNPALPVKTDGDPFAPSLAVTHGVNDIGTRQTTGMLNPEDTIAVIIDEARGVRSPYESLIVSEAVTKRALSEIQRLTSLFSFPRVVMPINEA
ncbi:hypothetical protein HY469_06085 [Candidatus Roizmanbacteria bacterium]|nr:hypothetical protein [Candidatus Roizmanbacteria bacterium]